MNSLECLKKIKETLGEEWKKSFVDYLSDEGERDDVSGELFGKFTTLYREDIIEGKSKKEIEKFINNDLVFANLNEVIDDMLSAYYASASIRAMEKKQLEKAKECVGKIFHKGVLRFYPEIISEYKEYEFDSAEAFSNFLNAFGALCDFIVEQNFYYDSIVKALYNNMRLSKELCEYIAELIEKNFQTMKLTLILKKINE